MSVSVTVEIRDASEIEIGTVYGPPPMRTVGGGVTITCADPMPADDVVAPVAVAGAGTDGGGGVIGAAG